MNPAQSVELARWLPGRDSHGSDKPGWADPVRVRVYGWAPAGSSQGQDGNREPVEAGVEVFAPSGVAALCGPKDRWLVGGNAYLQQGHAEDFSHGPFGFAAGCRIKLKRVEG